MEIFWAILVTTALTLIILGMINSSRTKKKNAKITERYLKEVDDYVRAGETYTVVLNDGKRFESSRIVGYSQFHDGLIGDVQFPAGKWLILEVDGRRVFLRPRAVRYFEQPLEANG